MVVAMRNELFGSCTNHGECEAVCPKQIPMEFIGKMNRDLIRAVWHRRREPLVIPGVVQLPSVEDSHEQLHDGIQVKVQANVGQRFHQEAPAQVGEESPEHAGFRR